MAAATCSRAPRHRKRAGFEGLNCPFPPGKTGMLYSPPAVNKAPIPLKLLFIAAGIFYLIFILGTSSVIKGERYFTLLDDAMVSMRYARHLTGGYGLVWNIGEPPVEGFTNFGWMLLMALLHLFALAPAKISLGVMLASAAILLTNVWVVYRICAELGPGSKFAPLLAAGVTAFYFPLVFWSLRGMEVGLLTLLIDLGILLAVRIARGPRGRLVLLISLVAVLAVLVRLDAAIPLLVIAACLLFEPGTPRRAAAWPILAIVLTGAALLWFQHSYFGDFLPNTYYQKMGGYPAWERIRNGLLMLNEHAARDFLAPALIALAGMIAYKDLRGRAGLLLGCIFLSQIAYSVWIGGDYAEAEVDVANRFITQGMPALFILFSLAADRILTDVLAARRPKSKLKPGQEAALSLCLAAGLLLVVSGEPWMKWAIDNAPLLKADIRRVKLGLFLAQYTSPEATIAVHAAGQIPYFSDRRTIDLLGLNDPVVARGPASGPFYPGHDKWNYEYSIMQLQPDLIADNWDKLADFMRDKTEYRKLENGIYVRLDSRLIDLTGLSREYR